VNPAAPVTQTFAIPLFLLALEPVLGSPPTEERKRDPASGLPLRRRQFPSQAFVSTWC
jgi:hypothetical protein